MVAQLRFPKRKRHSQPKSVSRQRSGRLCPVHSPLCSRPQPPCKEHVWGGSAPQRPGLVATQGRRAARRVGNLFVQSPAAQNHRGTQPAARGQSPLISPTWKEPLAPPHPPARPRRGAAPAGAAVSRRPPCSHHPPCSHRRHELCSPLRPSSRCAVLGLTRPFPTASLLLSGLVAAPHLSAQLECNSSSDDVLRPQTQFPPQASHLPSTGTPSRGEAPGRSPALTRKEAFLVSEAETLLLCSKKPASFQDPGWVSPPKKFSCP